MAESHAICRYLAKKYGYLGTEPHETALIDMYYESWCEIEKKYTLVITNKLQSLLSTEMVEKEKANWSDKVLLPILSKHEEALAKNGTGYYVGDKVSLTY
jgi:glutathione S-transferase